MSSGHDWTLVHGADQVMFPFHIRFNWIFPEFSLFPSLEQEVQSVAGKGH